MTWPVAYLRADKKGITPPRGPCRIQGSNGMNWVYRKWRRSFLFTVGALLALGGIAYATIPDGSGVIHSCYSNSSGSLRVINAPSQNCTATETALAWNQTGPTGPTGTPGTQ